MTETETGMGTSTALGIVYPPAYAAQRDGVSAHLRVERLLEAGPDARLGAEVRFVAACGPGHRAAARTATLPDAELAQLAAVEAVQTFGFASDGGSLDVRLRLSASPPHRGRSRVILWVENRTPVASGLDHRAALRHALCSTHPILRVVGGRFVSPQDADRRPSAPRRTTAPPTPSPGLADPTLGEHEAQIEGVVLRHGATVVLRPGPQADLHARMAAGRRATVEKILVDYDGKVHVGVTVDGDPGQELLRETGRLLYFFTPELEILS